MTDLHLTKDDARKVIQARVGDTIHVSLDEVPTTGFKWSSEVASGEDVLRSQPESHSSQSPTPGAGGTHTFSYELAAPGRGALRFQLRRPWGDAEPAERHEYTVEVT